MKRVQPIDIIDIYIDKYFGNPLNQIVKKYNLKNHSVIYYYVNKVDNEIKENSKFEKLVKQKKDEYKIRNSSNRISQ